MTPSEITELMVSYNARGISRVPYANFVCMSGGNLVVLMSIPSHERGSRRPRTELKLLRLLLTQVPHIHERIRRARREQMSCMHTKSIQHQLTRTIVSNNISDWARMSTI